jgi:hypothetical protein
MSLCGRRMHSDGSAAQLAVPITMPAAKKPAARKPTATKPRRKAVKRQPRLLAGGNPQIAKGDGDAPVQAYIAAIADGWKRETAARLDAIITRAVPATKKAVKWNSPFYGIEGQGWFLSLHVFTRFIKVAFFRGADLDPPPPGASQQKDVRYLDVHEGALDEKQFARWVKQASKLAGWVHGMGKGP